MERRPPCGTRGRSADSQPVAMWQQGQVFKLKVKLGKVSRCGRTATGSRGAGRGGRRSASSETACSRLSPGSRSKEPWTWVDVATAGRATAQHQRFRRSQRSIPASRGRSVDAEARNGRLTRTPKRLICRNLVKLQLHRRARLDRSASTTTPRCSRRSRATSRPQSAGARTRPPKPSGNRQALDADLFVVTAVAASPRVSDSGEHSSASPPEFCGP
jgi:hypothetical protein